MKATRVTTLLALLMFFVAGCTKPDAPNDGGGDSGGDNGGGNNGGDTTMVMESIDLGLPSGTLWATCNVGADTPEGYGDYYAWAETSPKDHYYWNTYRYCKGLFGTFTKYCNVATFGYNGFTDDQTVLQPDDDAATVNWGSDWRTPDLEQWEELINNTSHEWVKQNEVWGQVFHGNGQSLFLPAGGYFDIRGLTELGECGYYWSNSLCADDPVYANYFIVNLDGAFTSDFYNRCCGFSVRAVRSEK